AHHRGAVLAHHDNLRPSIHYFRPRRRLCASAAVYCMHALSADAAWKPLSTITDFTFAALTSTTATATTGTPARLTLAVTGLPASSAAATIAARSASGLMSLSTSIDCFFSHT